MRVLVIGGSGYVGGHVAERLRTRGFDVTVFARGRTHAPFGDDIAVISGDRRTPGELRRVANLGFDAVVDVCAYRRKETQAAVDAFDGRVARFVHISTISVNRMTSGFPLRESDPLVTDPAFGYGYDKAECERALNQAHAKNDFPFVSIRPAVIFGPRDRISRENHYIKRLLSGDAIILPDGGLTMTACVYVLDLADAVAAAIVSEAAAGRAYHLMMREHVKLADHVASLAALVGREAETVAIPSRLLERVGFNLLWFPYYAGDRTELTLDTSAAARDLDWRPTPYAEALETTVRWFLDEGPESLPSIEDRFPPVMPRAVQSEFARRYRDRAGVFEDEIAAEAGNLMAGYSQ
jgi:nucleoside-diphosphate-sugar epimerase